MKEELLSYFNELNNDSELGFIYEEEYCELVHDAVVIWSKAVLHGRTPTEGKIKAQQYLNTHPFIQPLLSMQFLA
jgi:hypothetical protein